MEARVEMTLYVLNSSGDRRVDLLHWRFLLGARAAETTADIKPQLPGAKQSSHVSFWRQAKFPLIYFRIRG